MNFAALTGLGHEHVTDHDWRSAAERFLSGVRANPIVRYTVGSTCEVATNSLLGVAGMQVRLRHKIESAMRYADGTTYHRYCARMRGKGDWKFHADLPTAPQMYLSKQALVRQIDVETDALELPYQTCSWFQAQYRAVLQQAERLSELGRAFASKNDALYGELTGNAPTGKVRALFTPRSIHFRCATKDDCAKLMYPDERTPSLQERRDEIRTSRGSQRLYKLPATMGGDSVSITAENVEVTAGKDAFGTFDHEQEHALNAFAKHPSTSLGRAPRKESGLEFCARMGVADMVKEECIAWSLRPNVYLPGLFLGTGASYQPVKQSVRHLREANERKALLDIFTLEAGQHLATLVPAAANAVELLMHRYPRDLVREVLRLKPVHEWTAVADQWSS